MCTETGSPRSGGDPSARPTLATTPNPLILMPLSPRQGGHRTPMAGTIGLFGIGSVGAADTRPFGPVARYSTVTDVGAGAGGSASPFVFSRA